MFMEGRGQKPSKPQRGVMVGHVQAIPQTEQAAPLTISPGWGLQRQEALNYKHCVPTGLKPVAMCRWALGYEKLGCAPSVCSAGQVGERYTSTLVSSFRVSLFVLARSDRRAFRNVRRFRRTVWCASD